MFRKITQSGFSLTELSISLAIIALLAGSALSVMISSDFHVKKAETRSKLDRIEEALAGYVQTNHRLPCPADGTLASTHASFGLEGTPTTTDCPNKNFTISTAFAGAVPVRTLQLPDDFISDGWGNRFTYVVDLPFANNEITNVACTSPAAVCFRETTAGSLTINDDSDTARTTAAVYVVISHGEDAHGAYPKNGGSTRINAYNKGFAGYVAGYADELENAHLLSNGSDDTYDKVYIEKDYTRDDTNSIYFDDILRYKTKAQVVYSAGALIYDSICRIAHTVTTIPGANDCVNADDEGNCINMATEVDSRCLQ